MLENVPNVSKFNVPKMQPLEVLDFDLQFLKVLWMHISHVDFIKKRFDSKLADVNTSDMICNTMHALLS